MLRFTAFLGAILYALFGVEAAMADTAPATTVSFLGFYQAAEPYLVSLFVAIVMTALGLLWQQAQARLKILQTTQAVAIEAQARAAFQTAATNAAGRYLANQEGKIAGLKVNVHSEGIAAEVNNVQNLVPDAISKLGISPDQVGDAVAKTIVGKIGQLQAVAESSTAGPTVISGPNADTAVVNVTPTPGAPR